MEEQMAAVVTRKQTSFRLNEDLMDCLRLEAKKYNRSLNNLVESILISFLENRPNDTTLAAMKEAESNADLETIELKNFRKLVDSL